MTAKRPGVLKGNVSKPRNLVVGIRSFAGSRTALVAAAEELLAASPRCSARRGRPTRTPTWTPRRAPSNAWRPAVLVGKPVAGGLTFHRRLAGVQLTSQQTPATKRIQIVVRTRDADAKAAGAGWTRSIGREASLAASAAR